ncbi:unnamed protein product [Dibothriocephalus latus]|uniref:Uncharacterized protein n=1 Tax=Dibothriocephalus latus TaxID=60516 RepID=A0A3P7MVB4_DIBLA|nr:unnamed protein product [Dibothriocephalus latus]
MWRGHALVLHLEGVGTVLAISLIHYYFVLVISVFLARHIRDMKRGHEDTCPRGNPSIHPSIFQGDRCCEEAGAFAASPVATEVDCAGDVFGCLAADICPTQPENADQSLRNSGSGRSSYVYTPWSDISGMSSTGSADPSNAEPFQNLPDGAVRHSPSTPAFYVHDVCEGDGDGMSSAAGQCIRCHFLETRAGLTERMNQISARRPARVPSPYPSHVWDEDSLASSELSFGSTLVAWQSSSPSSRTPTDVHVEGRADVGDASSAQNFVPPWKMVRRGRRSVSQDYVLALLFALLHQKDKVLESSSSSSAF